MSESHFCPLFWANLKNVQISILSTKNFRFSKMSQEKKKIFVDIFETWTKKFKMPNLITLLRIPAFKILGKFFDLKIQNLKKFLKICKQNMRIYKESLKSYWRCHIFWTIIVHLNTVNWISIFKILGKHIGRKISNFKH